MNPTPSEPIRDSRASKGKITPKIVAGRTVAKNRKNRRCRIACLILPLSFCVFLYLKPSATLILVVSSIHCVLGVLLIRGAHSMPPGNN